MKRRDLLALLAGAAIASPLAGRAQQPMPVIGWLSPRSPETDDFPERLGGFRQGLNEMGYVEGQNVTIEYQWADGHYDRAPDLAADLVRRQVGVIVAVSGAPMAFAAKAATATIPIVFALGLDPVQLGLVPSLNRPGGNLTGVTGLAIELIGERLDLLHELVPTAAVIGFLVNPMNPVATSETANLKNAVQALGLKAHVLEIRSPGELEAAFESLAGLGAGALGVGGDPLFTNNRAEIVALAARHALPAIYAWCLFLAAGGLISYRADLVDVYRQAGVLTGKILKGAEPADLPVQQAAKVELVVNLKTAKTLGLMVPMTLLTLAGEVIE